MKKLSSQNATIIYLHDVADCILILIHIIAWKKKYICQTCLQFYSSVHTKSCNVIFALPKVNIVLRLYKLHGTKFPSFPRFPVNIIVFLQEKRKLYLSLLNTFFYNGKSSLLVSSKFFLFLWHSFFSFSFSF